MDEYLDRDAVGEREFGRDEKLMTWYMLSKRGNLKKVLTS